MTTILKNKEVSMSELRDVSMNRLLNHSEEFCFMFVNGVKYEVMTSIVKSPVQQFYIIDINWRENKPASRVDILGHGYKHSKQG